MNPFQLVREGTDKPVAQACGKCGQVYRLGDASAVRCCDPRCSDCGESCERGWTRCQSCRHKVEAVKDAEMRTKAKRVPEAEYDGPLYFDGAWNDGYLQDAEDFRDWWETNHDETESMPTDAWACNVERIQLPRADRIIEQATEDAYDGAYDDMPDEAELQAAIDAYNASVTAANWTPDFSRLVVLDHRPAPVA